MKDNNKKTNRTIHEKSPVARSQGYTKNIQQQNYRIRTVGNKHFPGWVCMRVCVGGGGGINPFMPNGLFYLNALNWFILQEVSG